MVRGTGRNTLSLIDMAIEIREREQKAGKFDQCWCVFDKDSFDDDNFDNAVAKAEAQGFRVAYSNEAFELWYLLHFSYCDARLARQALCDKLDEALGAKYDKAAAHYEALLPLQAAALRNARKLMSTYIDVLKPHERSPGTTVHELVEELNKNVAW